MVSNVRIKSIWTHSGGGGIVLGIISPPDLNRVSLSTKIWGAMTPCPPRYRRPCSIAPTNYRGSDVGNSQQGRRKVTKFEGHTKFVYILFFLPYFNKNWRPISPPQFRRHWPYVSNRNYITKKVDVVMLLQATNWRCSKIDRLGLMVTTNLS